MDDNEDSCTEVYERLEVMYDRAIQFRFLAFENPGGLSAIDLARVIQRIELYIYRLERAFYHFMYN